MEKAMKITQRQCVLAMISAAVVVICVCVGVTMNLTTVYDENFDHMGIRTFCMFTVNSNILCGAAMAMVFPYTLDGLRKHNYHIPKWVMVLVFAGVTAVTLTFLISLCVLAPAKGFALIFSGSRFFLHGVCPVLALLAFCFFMSEQQLSWKDTLLALIPVAIYSAVYYVMVAVVGEDRGGWNDFYGFLTRLPHWIPLSLILPVTFGIASLIRFLHNRTYLRRGEEEAKFFKETFAKADVRKIVAALARSHASSMKLLDILIPTRVISIILEYNEGDATLEECCEIYLKEYMENSDMIRLEDQMDKMWI